MKNQNCRKALDRKVLRSTEVSTIKDRVNRNVSSAIVVRSFCDVTEVPGDASAIVIAGNLESDVAIDSQHLLLLSRQLREKVRVICLFTPVSMSIERLLNIDSWELVCPGPNTLLVDCGNPVSTPRLFRRIRNAIPLVRQQETMERLISRLPALNLLDLDGYLYSAMSTAVEKSVELVGKDSIEARRYFYQLCGDVHGWSEKPSKQDPRRFVEDDRQHNTIQIDSTASFSIEKIVAGISLLDINFGAIRQLIVRESGTRFPAYLIGDVSKPCVLFCNAVGMPVEMVHDILVRLQDAYCVLTFEARYLFNRELGQSDFDHSLNALVEDLDACLKHYRIDSKVTLIGVCIGAVVALEFAARYPLKLDRLVLANPAYSLDDDTLRTSYERDSQRVLREAADSERKARLIRMTFARTNQSVLSEQELMALAQYPYTSGDLLFHYASMVNHLIDEPIRPLAKRVKVPVVTIISKDDELAHPEAAAKVAKLFSDSTVHEFPEGGHFQLLFENQPLAQALVELPCRLI